MCKNYEWDKNTTSLGFTSNKQSAFSHNRHPSKLRRSNSINLRSIPNYYRSSDNSGNQLPEIFQIFPRANHFFHPNFFSRGQNRLQGNVLDLHSKFIERLIRIFITSFTSFNVEKIRLYQLRCQGPKTAKNDQAFFSNKNFSFA